MTRWDCGERVHAAAAVIPVRMTCEKVLDSVRDAPDRPADEKDGQQDRQTASQTGMSFVSASLVPEQAAVGFCRLLG